MTALDGFWDHYEQCSTEIAGATTVDQVIETCLKHFGKSSGDAFFPGSSGDTEMLTVLEENGWEPSWVKAYYHFAIGQPDGKDGLTFVEGDIYRGVQKPL